MYEKKIIEFCFKRIEKAGKRRKRMKIILASASPRRKELLEQIGVKFLIQPAAGEEKITKTIPDEVVTELALQKAREVAKDREEPVLIIGADTVVAYQDEMKKMHFACCPCYRENHMRSIPVWHCCI